LIYILLYASSYNKQWTFQIAHVSIIYGLSYKNENLDLIFS